MSVITGTLKRPIITLLSLLFVLLFQTSFGQVLITLDQNSTNELKAQPKKVGNENVFQLETQGSDPHIYSSQLPNFNPDSLNYISFDYLAPAGLDNLQIYFGPPYNENRCLKIGKVPPTSSFKRYGINVYDYTGFWNQSIKQFRFDFGNTSNQKITVKNIRLTKPLTVEADRTAIAKQQEIRKYISSRFLSNVSDVTVNKDEVIIKGNATEPNSFLCEIAMYEEPKSSPSSFVSITPITGKQFEVKKERFIAAKEPYDRLYSRWIVAVRYGTKYTAKSFAHYADNIYGAALQYLPEEKPQSKKGLAGFIAAGNTTPDLNELDIKNTTVNIVLPTIVSLKPTALSFDINGQKIFFDPAAISILDNTIKTCTERNIIVSSILIIPRSLSGELKRIFVHAASNGGVQSMANLTSITGFNYYRAAAGFLAERYSRLNKQYGRVQNWIIHNEVDNAADWTNAGNIKMENYVELYDRSLRTIYYTVRQYNPAAKVFLSLTHYWNGSHKGIFYPPHQFLNTFNNLAKNQGDYEWGVAYHPYPQNSFDPRSWNDPDVSNDLNTSDYITPKNIELIDEWIRMRKNLYKGVKVRTLLFSEQGVHSASNETEDLKLQAAGLAYMWKKFTRLPSLEAFHYHRIVDVRSESGLLLGLKTARPGTDSEPDKKKPSWYVYEKAGTNGEDNAFSFALPVIGVRNWNETFNPLKGEVLPLTVSFNVINKSKQVNDVEIFFNGEMHKTINGKATFYNVASTAETRSYQLVTNGKTVKDGRVGIAGSQPININVELSR